MSVALHILRNADIWVSTKKVALICNRDVTWVQKNKARFTFRRQKVRKLEIELSSALEVQMELKGNRHETEGAISVHGSV
jgi:hypothetical protein